MSKALLTLEMPSDCVNCPLSTQILNKLICQYTGLYGTEKERPGWCPLHEAELVRHGSYKTIVDNSCWFNECSVCGNRIEFGYMLSPYCPNCGAKMDLKWRDDDNGGAG